MCEGEFESLKAIHAVSPSFVPKPYAWGKHTREGPESYFLLTEFRDVGRQVCALRFAIFGCTPGKKDLSHLPFREKPSICLFNNGDILFFTQSCYLETKC